MLVLSRQRDQTIKIGDDIDITIVAIKGDRVRVGIAAPPEVPVHRKEIFDEIQSKRGQESADDASKKGTRWPYHPPAFTGAKAEEMLRILDKQIRMLENVSKQGSHPEFAERYQKLCAEMIELVQ